MSGLRERKKVQTRQHIAECAMRLFVARGFDHVTIAEVVAAAEVSVNTVYNYFQVKEDLVLPPDQASPQRLATMVRDRPPGTAAARAVLDRLRPGTTRLLRPDLPEHEAYLLDWEQRRSKRHPYRGRIEDIPAHGPS